MGMDNDLNEFITEASAIRQHGPRTPLERQVVAALGEIERLRSALKQAYLDGGCREDEAEEMVRALSRRGTRHDQAMDRRQAARGG